MATRKKKEQPVDLASKIKKEGAFREWCKKRGYSKVTSRCIQEGLASKNPTVRKRAAMAKGFATMRKKRRKRK